MDLAIYRLLLLGALVAATLLPGGAGGPLPARAQAPVDVTCHACLVIDDRGATIFSRRAELPLPNASTTKMLTALVALRALEPEQEIEVSPRAAAVPGGRLALIARERWSSEELFHALLLGSSNDAAVALAEAVAGTEESFVSLMNEKARRLGATDTVAVTSHGLDAPEHVSSARDLATIAREVLAEPLLAGIVMKKEVTISSSRRTVTVPNTNELMGSYRGAIGVKTGFTSDAGNVLVAAARRQRRTIIAVAMRADDPFEDARRLLDLGFERLRRGVLLEEMTSLGDLVFLPSGSTGVVAARPIRGITHPDEVTIDFVPYPGVTPPIRRGDVVGTVTAADRSGRALGSVPALATRDVEAGSPSWIEDALSEVLGTVAGLVGEP